MCAENHVDTCAGVSVVYTHEMSLPYEEQMGNVSLCIDLSKREHYKTERDCQGSLKPLSFTPSISQSYSPQI